LSSIRRRIAALPILHKILLTNSLIILIGAAVGIAVTEKVVEEGQFTPVTYAIIVLGTIVLGATLNYSILKVAFRPLEALQAVVRQVHAGNLRARATLDRASDPDIGHFSTALNTMLERMEANERIIREDKRQLQILAAQVITAQEEERKRVARELHDEASQALTTLIIGLETVLESMPPDLAEPHRQVLALRTLAEQTLDEIRNLALSLRPTVLDDLGLPSAVRWYAKSTAEKAGFRLSLELLGLEERLPSRVETAVFRIVQEALANVAKHAQAQEVLIRLERSDHQISLLIRDDGQGFNVGKVLSSRNRGAGLGIFGIEERVTILGGKWELQSEAGRGTELRVTIPLGDEGV
jgi:two-component system, NarL family, sensor histidine kinase UhpB